MSDKNKIRPAHELLEEIHNEQNDLLVMTPAERKLQNYFEKIFLLVEKSSKSSEDSILLAGAMMSVARIIYFDNLVEKEADAIIEHNTRDFINLIKPTIH
tara:strand:- start:92 stop:391 length:300 start_codon:yes stop_codon:yes gene_type:complete